ncbi:hypothetical protein DFH28DRAFT_939761 [Melampsora americana]|nr:hypothetical protein DFH28DRAFT_939761 [Melampsora americana]
MSSVTSERPIRSRKQVSTPGMINTGSDSRRRLSIDSNTSVQSVHVASRSKHKKTTLPDTSDDEPAERRTKRKCTTEEVVIRSLSDSDKSSPVQTTKKKRKQKSQNNNNKSVSKNVTKAILQADSGAEDNVIAVKKQKSGEGREDLKRLRAYYLPPIHEPFDDRSKPKIAYPCRFCHRDDTNPVRDASLHGRRWAADEAKSINVSLKEQVFAELKAKEAAQGHFPSIGTITEEDEDEEPKEFQIVDAEDPEHDPQDIDTDLPDPAEDVADLDDEVEWNAADAEEEDRFPELESSPVGNEVQPTHRREANNVDYILRKVDFITRRITRSAPWRNEFQRVAAQKGFTGSLIAGYGIRWNIKYQSRHKAWLARAVIDELCRNDLDKVHSKNRPARKNRKPPGYFHELEMTTSEWAQVRKINTELEPFLKTTLLMEGDGPTGCMVIPQYLKLQNSLEKKIKPLSTSDAIYPMLAKMKEKTIEYMNKALACETLVMATLLHPFFRLKFFIKWFGEFSAVAMNAEATLRRLYTQYELDNPTGDIPKPTSSHNSKAPMTSSPKAQIFCEDSEDEADLQQPEDNHIKNYLQRVHRMKAEDYNVEDPASGLLWWKVMDAGRCGAGK